MADLYRIKNRNQSLHMATDNKVQIQSYVDRLIKLIPAEVVGLYVVGAGLIPADQKYALVGWAVFCMIFLLISRILGTKSSKSNKTQWPTVVISTISFIIWLYVMGGPFEKFDIHIPWLGSLIMVAWTSIVPLIYHGDAE